MSADADRPNARTAATMGDTECLMKVQMAYIGPELAGLGHPDQCIEIGAVGVDLTTGVVYQFAHPNHGVFVHAMGGGIGDHQGSQVLTVLGDLGFEVRHVHVAPVVALDHDHLHASHNRRCGIGSMGR